MSQTAWRDGITTFDGTRLRYREAGTGDAVLCFHQGEVPPRALDLIAARRRVVMMTPPAGTTARRLNDAFAALGIVRCDVLGAGGYAALALGLKALAPERIAALVLMGPTLIAEGGGATDAADQDFLDTIGETARPCLALFGTRDKTVPVTAARHYRERIADCNLVFIYDASEQMAEERPEAIASIVVDFLDRQNLFLVRRESDLIFP
jgi:pimeloyl-ACP methyl ester carboxylesterase